MHIFLIFFNSLLLFLKNLSLLGPKPPSEKNRQKFATSLFKKNPSKFLKTPLELIIIHKKWIFRPKFLLLQSKNQNHTTIPQIHTSRSSKQTKHHDPDSHTMSAKSAYLNKPVIWRTLSMNNRFCCFDCFAFIMWLIRAFLLKLSTNNPAMKCL